MQCMWLSKASAKVLHFFDMTKFFDALFINISTVLSILKMHLAHNKTLTIDLGVENFWGSGNSTFPRFHTSVELAV